MARHKHFTVALIGRPNVGKSSLFNALLGYRRAIVFDLPGTTRDEVIERVKWSETPLRLADAQGMFGEEDNEALESILAKGDAYLFVVDAMTGPTPFDKWLAGRLLIAKKPTLLVVNKSEAKRSVPPEDFAILGFPESIAVSVEHRHNIPDVKEWLLKLVPQPAPKPVLPELSENFEGDEPIVIAEDIAKDPETLTFTIVGRPNSGKSTLMNRLCGDKVSRVSPIAHTTRDAVTWELETPRGKVRLIDTAGMRRPRSEKEKIEEFSINATTRAIREADVVFLSIACHEPITDQDMRLLNLIEREGKPAAVLLNFWDKLNANERKHFLEDSDFARVLKNFKLLPMSGLTGWQVDRCLPLAFQLSKNAQKRIRTSRLNKFVETLVRKNPPPSAGRLTFNILYASQVKTEPPTFVFFMNRKGNLPASYEKYVENALRKHLNMHGQTLRVSFRGSDREKRPNRFSKQFSN